jgi:hypothetical protein
VTGTFKGDLRTVVSKLLGARNHVLRPGTSGLALYVMGGPSALTRATAPAAVAPAQLEPAPGAQTLSPKGQALAQKMFGDRAKNVQIDETLLTSFANGRGGRRFMRPLP